MILFSTRFVRAFHLDWLQILVFIVAFQHWAWAANPNIVFILCDDLGYGDVQFLNPKHGKIPTPNIDSIFREGMTFTDAHSGASVCTPTRLGIMTGRYSWRTSLQRGVVVSYAPSLIKQDRVTLASFLQTQGYHTAAIGKWHLNFRYVHPISGSELAKSKMPPPVGATTPDGPIHRGFDKFHGFHHSRIMRAVIENDRVVEHDDVENMLPRLATKSVEYIRSRKDLEQPFFLYVPLNSPHTPVVPTKEWKGKSQLGDYGDFVMQTDDVVGQITNELKANGLVENTILIFTSDNGSSSRVALSNRLKEQGHLISAHYRGSKADIWDGGHRMPLAIRWPGKINAGSTLADLVCLNDIFATIADLLEQQPPANSCEDSVSFLPQLLGQTNLHKRKDLIHHSGSGHFAIRRDNWKLILARGSGGWSSPTEQEARQLPIAQLYDLDADPSETNNCYAQKPKIAKRLLERLRSEIGRGRTTPGQPSRNDVKEIDLWKSEPGPRIKSAGYEQ